MERLDTAAQMMDGLRAEGIHFCIDDFGTGYSSLSYLSSLPIDSLKIDRSFVDQMQLGPQNIEIVRAIQTLCLAVKKKVIAEGIETPRQLALLREMRVECGQGYLLGRPLKPEQVTSLPLELATILT